MVDYTAANLQTLNKYSNLNNTTLELLIDGMISHINSVTGASLAHFRDDTVGAAGSKTVSISEAQESAFLSGAALMLRAFKEKGPQVNAGPASITAVISDPHFRVYTKLFNQSLNYLRGRSFQRT